MDNFENWFKKINEELSAETTNAEISGRSDIMVDVDTIMNSLETLASELKEELALEEEALTEGAKDFIKQWITSLKAVSSQKKVNKVKMNAADLEFAAKKFDGDKKQSMKDKAAAVTKQAGELQTMVNNKFAGKGDIVDRKLSSTKIKGQLEIIKRTSGMEQNPNKKASLKMKMKELTAKFAEEQQAIASLEQDNQKEVTAAKQEVADKNDPKKKNKKSTTNVEGEPPAETTGKAKTKVEGQPEGEPPAETTGKAKTKVEGQPEAEPPAETTGKAKTKVEGDPEGEPPAETTGKAKTKVEGDPEEEKDKEKKVDDSVQIDNELITRAKHLNLNELATEIESKLDWQIAEGSVLASNYEAIIKKAESDKILNESKYQVNSIKDAFKKLM
jgi:hypothetical protein